MIQLAEQTLARIETVMSGDQGASFRQALQRVLPHMSDAYRGEDEGFRTHMGASAIGGECGRAIWYNFHWATKSKFDARILRLFNRGHLEEARFLAMLLAIGCEVYQHDADGKQFRISDVGGHFGGSGDGVVIGLPDLAPGTAALLEFKTHNDKSFKKLQAEGVRVAKFVHYVQMQIYMGKMGLAVAMYGAVNKNDDAIHLELVAFDRIIYERFIERGRTLVMMREEPTRINNSAGFFECKWCDHKPICHLNKEPERTCRSCRHSEVKDDGKWYCNNEIIRADADMQGWEDPIVLEKEHQLAACKHYENFFAKK